jgi:hypothetical protein
MEMIFCPNCQKLTGYKRALGFGTFFAVVFTAGFWLVPLLFYPKRCINCGLTKSDSVSWHRTWRLPVLVFLAIVAILYSVTENRDQEISESHPARIVKGPDYNESLPLKVGNPGQGGVQANDDPDTHELRLLPNLSGAGAISDGRTYSVALVVSSGNKIPSGTKLFMQGKLSARGGGDVGGAMLYSVMLSDEQRPDRYLTCFMSAEEFSEVDYLYQLGDSVQAFGKYVGPYNGGPGFADCRIASPQGNVVRPDRTAEWSAPARDVAEPQAESEQ